MPKHDHVSIDDLDALELGSGVALDGLRALMILLDTVPSGEEVPARSLGSLLHCIHQTATAGWPFEGRR